MKKTILSFMLWCLIYPALPAHAKRELCGNVSVIEDNEKQTTPVKKTKVLIFETGDSNQTDDDGNFHIFLKDIWKAGEKIILKVEKEGYQIYQPVGGEVRIPADLEKDREKVLLDKLGSHRFFSNQAFAMLIENAARESTKTVSKSDEKPDLSRYLKEWAVKYGFGIDDVKTELDKWAADIEKRQDNLYELGLAAFYRKNFKEADEKFTESAKKNEQKLAKHREQEKKIREDVIRDWQLAGRSRYNDMRFQDALEAYQKALAEIDKAKTPETWAAVMFSICNTYSQLGMRIEGQAAQQHLANAVKGYQELLKIQPRDSLPQDWATTQNNMGAALQEQGTRTGGEEGAKLLSQAVDAYRAALTVRTRESLPQDWAMTQNNLGNALREQAIIAPKEKKPQLFKESISAFNLALEILTFQHIPGSWAIVQNCLADTYFAMKDWAKAAECYKNVLKVYPNYEEAIQRLKLIRENW